MSLLKRILKNGRAFHLPNTKQFASIKTYRCFTPITAIYNGRFWERVKL